MNCANMNWSVVADLRRRKSAEKPSFVTKLRCVRYVEQYYIDLFGTE